MSTYVNLPGGPESAVRVGLKLKGLAADLAKQAGPILAHINDLEHQPIWGDDDPGHDLYKRYTQDTPSGPFNESLKKQLQDSGKSLDQITDIIHGNVGDIQNSDIDSSHDIASL
jgi:hypothetical protein